MKVIMKCVNIKLWDILGCFHYILNAPRICMLEGQKMFSFCVKFLHCRDDREQYGQKVIFFENSLNMLKNVRVAGKKNRHGWVT